MNNHDLISTVPYYSGDDFDVMSYGTKFCASWEPIEKIGFDEALHNVNQSSAAAVLQYLTEDSSLLVNHADEGFNDIVEECDLLMGAEPGPSMGHSKADIGHSIDLSNV